MLNDVIKYFQTEQEVVTFVDRLFLSTRTADNDNLFWDMSASMLIKSVVLLVVNHCPLELRTKESVIRFLREMEEEKGRERMEEIFSTLERLNKDELAVRYYNSAKISAGCNLDKVAVYAINIIDR